MRRWGFRTLFVMCTLAVATSITTPAMAEHVPPPPGAGAPVQFETNAESSFGVNVKALEHLLRYHGFCAFACFGGEPDGFFDDYIDYDVRQFQSSEGLSVDGIVGPQTWNALVPTVSEGAEGQHVAALRRLMHAKWDFSILTTHDYFGPVFEQHIRDFQAHADITVDGIVGPQTWRYLVFYYKPPASSRTCLGSYNGNTSDIDPWGTGSAVGFINLAGLDVKTQYGDSHRIAHRDLSYEWGGNIAGHGSHEDGMDADIRPMATNGQQCNQGLTWQSGIYSRARTTYMYEHLRDRARLASRDLHKKTFFNDPVLYDQYPEMSYLSNHDDHLHVRYCQVIYPPDSKYVC